MHATRIISPISEADLVVADRGPIGGGSGLFVATSQPRRPDTITLIDGKTFLATTVAGDVTPACAADVGLFHQDTRFLSFLELRVNGRRAVVLSANNQRNYLAQIELTVSDHELVENFGLPENTVHVRREQLLAGYFYDRITVENFNLRTVDLKVELEYDADFFDVFQVRGSAREKMGTYFEPIATGSSLNFIYRGLDAVLRHTMISFDPSPSRIDGRVARWDIRLGSLERFVILSRTHLGTESITTTIAVDDDLARSLSTRHRHFEEWRSCASRFDTSHETFNTAIEQAAADFHALQVPYYREGSAAQLRSIAAGIPWFATVFGRDSLIASYQSLCLDASLAKDTLRYLAAHQGTKMDDWRDEEPGKILHELREGEMSRCGEAPHSPYYGTVDATALFLIALTETIRWTADEELLRELWPAAERALEWIDRFADLDHDGFIEYQHRSSRGLRNQGWKDSSDFNLHRDGSTAETPIALSEVQGYVYDAKKRMARLYRFRGEEARAARLEQDAETLAARFEQAFWLEGEQFYALALDRQKKPLQVISSNPGHLLFSGLPTKSHARAVTKRLMQEDMFSGWGVRTLSASERTYNPLSYHKGSIWPHDNSLIVDGLCKYGYKREAERIFTALFQAALHFRNYRLPELFCGVQRGNFDQPVHFPVSCSPQAWASGAMFLMLQSLLGIRPNARKKELRIVNPVLPQWLDWVRIRRLAVGSSFVSLEFRRARQRTFCRVIDVQGRRLKVTIDFPEHKDDVMR